MTTAPDYAALHPGYRLRLFQQLHRIGHLLLQLLEAALPWCLVGAPAQDRGTVAKSLAAEMIVADLDHQLRLERTPLCRALGGPAARPARRVAGESGLADQFFKPVGESWLLLRLERRSEADMMQQAMIIIEPEQQ